MIINIIIMSFAEQIHISHKSALRIIRANQQLTYPTVFSISSNKIKQNQKFDKKTLDVWCGSLREITGSKIDVLTFIGDKQHKIQGYKFHKVNYKLPSYSFMEIDRDTYIPCPELLFCQLAEILPWEQLALVGLEICGNYTLVHDGQNDKIKQCYPITSPKKIISYIKKIKKTNTLVKKLNKAYNTALLLSPNSYSPQESNLYIILTVPHQKGGFGIKNLSFNKTIQISETAQEICMQKTIMPDLSNVNKKNAIEYDSNAFHGEAKQNNKDKLRINALKHDKWNVFSFVPDQIRNPQAFYRMALDILQANGQEKRIRTKLFYDKFLDLHAKLYNNQTRY